MKNLIILILFAAAVFGLYQYGFPAWNDIQRFRLHIAYLQDVKAKADDSAKNRDKILASLKDLDQDKLIRLEAMFPKKLDTEGAYYFFQQLVTQSSMQLNAITLTDSTTDASDTTQQKPVGTKYLTFNINATGSYSAVRSLIDVLENNGRLMDIDSIEISENAQRQYALTLTGKMYYGAQ